MVERERISALMDGELTDEEFAGRIQQLKSEEGAEDWRTYHLIGDVLRGDSMFSSELALEGLRISWVRQLPQNRRSSRPRPFESRPGSSSVTRWRRRLPVAGIALVGWFALVNQESGPVNVAESGASSTARPAPGSSASPAVPSARGGLFCAESMPKLSEYASGRIRRYPQRRRLHGVASYIRTVSTQDDADETMSLALIGSGRHGRWLPWLAV
jgi:hypothetical protein